MKQPFGVVLAGGLARRMGGGDKGLLDLGGRPVLDHVLDRIEPQVAAVALNANGDARRFDHYKLPVLPDPVENHPGPLAGVLAGLHWAAANGGDRIVTVAADTPFFPADLVPRLLLAAERADAPIALAETKDGRHPTFGIWDVSLKDDLARALADGIRKIVTWTDGHGAVSAQFEAHDGFDPFFNVNTPDDLDLARTMLKERAS
jgi:molybdopterin-guanine dinucleotide biosynthesis protein A